MSRSAAPTAEAVITVRDAVIGYAGRPVTRPLTLAIQAGEVVAILGPNGSGKSTLVRGLLRLAELQSGSVELFGTPLARVRDRSRIGYVPQRHTLSGSIRSTCREVVATGLLASRPWYRPVGAADREQITRALEMVGLADRAETDVATLSGGQQRRVLIARALVAEPDVLIMDEPTAGVDAAHQGVLAEVIRRLASTGVTMLVVTHELSALRGVVDRIIELDAGRLSFDGSALDYAEHHAALARAADASRGGTHEHVRDGHPDHGHHDGHHHEPEPGPATVLGAGPLDRHRPGVSRDA